MQSQHTEQVSDSDWQGASTAEVEMLMDTDKELFRRGRGWDCVQIGALDGALRGGANLG